MKLTGSYKQILKLAIPIMIGSAAQQVITLSDGIFLFSRGEEDFAAIGFVGVFYLVIAAIGYGFSKGGQIMIARREGEEHSELVGLNFQAMFIFELLLAIILFLFMIYGAPLLFSLILDSKVIYTKSLEYLDYRAWGVFFSYTGMAFIALYTGIARTKFIIVDTVVLGILNIILNYALINGHWGFPEMGISGAGLASTIAEIVAFVMFVAYVLWDKKAKIYGLFKKPTLDIALIKKQYSIAMPIVVQSVLGIGSWLIFFGIIENLGEHELAKANLVRYVYLFLSIPVWGYCSGINTMASNAIGQGNLKSLLPISLKTIILTLITTGIIALIGTLSVVFLTYNSPEYIVTAFSKVFSGLAYETTYQELTKSLVQAVDLIVECLPIFYVLIGVLITFSAGSVYFNTLSGTGATMQCLKIQAICIVFYLVYVYTVINYLHLGQEWAWAGEMLYWGLIWAATYWYLRSDKWQKIVV